MYHSRRYEVAVHEAMVLVYFRTKWESVIQQEAFLMPTAAERKLLTILLLLKFSRPIRYFRKEGSRATFYM